MLALTAELRRSAYPAGGWGTALAAFELLVVAPGAASIEAAELLPWDGSGAAGVTFSAKLEFAALPRPALGVVRLQTSAAVQGQRACFLVYKACT